MLKRISLRWRLTILTTLLMALCCICLSLVLSVSAYRMANTIEAIPVQPAHSIGDLPLEETMPPILPATSSDVAQQARGDYGYESLFFTLVAMVIGGCLTYYVAGKALEPVKAFNKQVKNIHVHNLKETLEVPPTGDEIAELAASFNDVTEKLDRAFYNLVENGIKYNVPGGRVAVEVRQGKDQVTVSVSDTGPGIPRAMREQVFEPFFRVDKSRSREMGGAGLGLSMVDAIVRQHGGTVSLADRQGGGSCFTVTLPIHP